jgi:hypothetical protein
VEPGNDHGCSLTAVPVAGDERDVQILDEGIEELALPTGEWNGGLRVWFRCKRSAVHHDLHHETGWLR